MKDTVHYAVLLKNSEAAVPYKYNEKEVTKYIQQNATQMNLQDKEFKGLAPLDKVLEGYKVFLAGEYHGNSSTYELQFYLTQYFHEKAGVNILLFEMDYATGKLIDTYIQTGDEALLERLMYSLRGTKVYTKEYKELLKNLYLYNKTQKNKLEVVGIDTTLVLENSEYLLKEIFKDKESGTTGSIQNKTYSSYEEKLKDLAKDLENHYDKYRKNLTEEELFDLEMLLLSTYPSYNEYAYSKLIREKIIITAFDKLLEKYSNEKFFGQYGAFHVGQTYNAQEKDGYTFAEYLQTQKEQTKGKVFSILYHYKNSYILQNNRSNKIEKNYPTLLEINSPSTFDFLLVPKDSIIANVYLPIQEREIEKVAQAYIQVKNSKACTPYE